MIIKAETRAFTAQLVVVNILVAIVGVVAYFVAGSFLIPFLTSLVVLNVAWYFFIYQRKRVVALELDEGAGRLILSFNGRYDTKSIKLEHLKLEFEQIMGQNDQKVTVLAIYSSHTLITRIRPGMTGFRLEDLERLEEHTKAAQ